MQVFYRQAVKSRPGSKCGAYLKPIEPQLRPKPVWCDEPAIYWWECVDWCIKHLPDAAQDYLQRNQPQSE